MNLYKRGERIRVVYDKIRWKLLAKLREEALRIMKVFVDARIFCLVHGSVARGDVDVNSDVDIFIPSPPSSFLIETTLRRSDETVDRRFLVQATPNYAPKAYLELNSETTVSFPLTKLRVTEREFYIFSGEATFEALTKRQRVSGVDKRLMLIQPNDEGHVESSIVGQEQAVAKSLGVTVNAVLVNALLNGFLIHSRPKLDRGETWRRKVFFFHELFTESPPSRFGHR